MDFTKTIYTKLLECIIEQNYTLLTFEEFIQNDEQGKKIVLRHDVDKLPFNSLRLAEIENSLGLKATYYFRVVPESWDVEIMKKIAALGHEIGYHYEEMDLANKKQKSEVGGQPVSAKRSEDGKSEVVKEELVDLALEIFKENIEKFREIYPVKTICMHGSPLSKYDNKDLWSHRAAFGSKYNYRDYGIIAEPYFDVDYDKVFYITDTGRAWNKGESSVRDRVNTRFDINIKSTQHMIELFNQNKMPDQIIINTHPQRWFNFGYGWVKELLLQNTKNIVKKILIKRRTTVF